MKNRKILQLLLLMLILIFIYFSGGNNKSLRNDSTQYDRVVKNSTPLGYQIHIDDSDPSKNWMITEATYDWCTGAGTFEDPYIIKEVEIDGSGSGFCILIENSNVYFRIENCTVYNSGSSWFHAGIRLDYVNNGMLINNNCSFNHRAGLKINNSNNNTILDNIINYNDDFGISITQSHNNSILGNTVNNNKNYDGIRINVSNNNTISGNTANGNYFAGILIYGSGENNKIWGNTLNANKYGLILDQHGGPIQYNYIFGNNASNNKYDGLRLEIDATHPRHNTFSENFVANNGKYGIFIADNTRNSTISGNIIKNNKGDGICLYAPDNNKIIGNTITNNKNGIYLYDSIENLILDNIVNYNTFCGINLSTSSNKNLISGNIASNNNRSGISLRLNCRDNNITGNIVRDNNNYGIHITSQGLTSSYNNLHDNYFINNTINARDEGNNNDWNSTVIGNYWNNYSDLDANDDGIGDTPYNITGLAKSIDHLPIWNDGIDLQGGVIEIDALERGVGAHNWTWASERFWCSSSGTFTDPYIIKPYKIWNLTINGGKSSSCISISNSNQYFRIENSVCYNSSISGAGIELYNTTNGVVIHNNISYNKGIGIILNSSDNNTISENNAQNNFHSGITIKWSDNNTISGNIVNHNDYAIILQDDCDSNVIFGNNIKENDLSGVNITTINCKDNFFYNNNFTGNLVYQANDNGSNNNWNNTVIGNFWSDYTGYDMDDDGIGDIPYNINGSANVNDSLPIWDDGDDNPIIIINSPYNNQIFANISPDFDIKIIAADKNSTWYTIDEGMTNITFSGLTGTINQTEWDKKGNGTVTITFYLNDTAGNEGYDKVTVWKDVYSPQINIISPIQNQIFGHNAPTFNISINEPDLNSTWYTLDGGVTNITFNELTGTINQTEWDKKGNGTITIRFYSNDIMGNEAFNQVTIWKDIEIPIIIINSPMLYQLFGNITINFEISIDEPNLNTTWYSLNNGLNYTFIENGTIEQAAWDMFGNGTVIIRFYANDTGGNVGFKEVTIRKDTNVPEIAIIKPSPNHLYGNKTINFELSIIEGNLNITWYSLNNGLNYTSGTSGIIEQAAWDACGNGTVIIRFYANDTVGNIASQDVVVWKYIYKPTILFEASKSYINTTKPEYFHKGLLIKCTVNDNIDITWVYLCENSTGQYVNKSMIDLGNGNWTYSLEISSLNWGNQLSFLFYANNSVGNIAINDNSSCLFSIKIYDLQNPSTEIYFIPHSETIKVNKSTIFTLNASDGYGSGISVIMYKINDSGWIIYNGSFDLSAYIYGDYLISFYAIDVVGNTEEIKTFLVTLVDIDTGIDGGDDEDDNGGDDENSGMTIPGYHLILLISIIGLISAILIIRKYKF